MRHMALQITIKTTNTYPVHTRYLFKLPYLSLTYLSCYWIRYFIYYFTLYFLVRVVHLCHSNSNAIRQRFLNSFCWERVPKSKHRIYRTTQEWDNVTEMFRSKPTSQFVERCHCVVSCALNVEDFISNNLFELGRAIAQAVSRWLPTAAARVRVRVWSCEICGGQSGAGADFLRVLRFPLPIFISPIAPQSP
jgi:hypothetical protein